MANQVPVYIQIHDQLKHEIEKGVWKIGARLPSERELSLRFGVSRMTLRQAIQTLSDEDFRTKKLDQVLMLQVRKSKKNEWNHKLYRYYGIVRQSAFK